MYWKVAVHRVHNLRPCTRFLFPVYSRTYYGLCIYCTVTFFTYKCTAHFRWRFIRAVILQRICRNSDTLSVYSAMSACLIIVFAFFLWKFICQNDLVEARLFGVLSIVYTWHSSSIVYTQSPWIVVISFLMGQSCCQYVIFHIGNPTWNTQLWSRATTMIF